MIVVRCSDETVIAYVHRFPKTLEVGYYLVNVFLGGNTLFCGFELYLLTVLVRACKEHYVVALHSLETCYRVTGYCRVTVTYVGITGGVIYRCG